MTSNVLWWSPFQWGSIRTISQLFSAKENSGSQFQKIPSQAFVQKASGYGFSWHQEVYSNFIAMQHSSNVT